MKILITGGAGFIGSHLADALLSLGHEVIILDNLLTGREDNIPKDAIYIPGDILDVGMKIIVHTEPDIVIHAAASYNEPLNHKRNVLTNALGSKVIADACFEAKVKKLIYFQTSLCYGQPKERPITLDHPIAPICSYAITKTAGEFFIRSGHTPHLIFRLANIYGPRNLSGPISIFYKNLMEGKQSVVSDTRRDYVYISDLVDIVLKGINGNSTGIYHAASLNDIPIAELYDRMIEATGCYKTVLPKEIKHGPLDIEHLLLDTSKTQADFNWIPQIDYETGLAKAVEWYDTHEFGKSHTHLEEFKQ